MFKVNYEKKSITYPLPEGMAEKMVLLAYPHKKLMSHELISGGCSNLNFQISLAGEIQPLILRVYLQNKEAPYIEQKLAVLLKQTVPVPMTYYIGEFEGYPFALTEFMPGIPLRDVLLGKAPHDVSALMEEVGGVLSQIAAYQFPKAGFLDKEMKVIPYKPSDIIKFVHDCLNHKTILAVLTSEMISKIQKIMERYAPLFPSENEKHLVHADFDPANILVDRVNGSWKISGILDWEFSFSGSILWDVSNMLRYAHKMPPEFQNSFLKGLEKGGIKLPTTWPTTIHLLNLSSLLDCLKRSDQQTHPNRCADIYELITHILQSLLL